MNDSDADMRTDFRSLYSMSVLRCDHNARTIWNVESMKMIAKHTLAFATWACTLIGVSQQASAQEYLDTAGRWKMLTLPSDLVAVPRSMVAHRGHVVIGREGRSVLVSSDSGETWTSTGGMLPAGLTTVWALAHPDTTATPDRILGVATTNDTPAHARLIESTDGGFTWNDGQALPDLDVLFASNVSIMQLCGPPAMQFAARSDNGIPAGFISSAAGLMSSADGGRTWMRRADSIAIRALAMADEQNGIAALGEHLPQRAAPFWPSYGGVWWTNDGGTTWTPTYRFPDGGFYQYISLHAFSKTESRALVPERYQNYLDWRLLRSSDGGRTWDDYRGRQARRPLYGLAVWRDLMDVHVIGDGAIVQHASDGGEIFHVLRDTTKGWWQTNIDTNYLVTAPVAASDDKYLYFATDSNNRMARWRMATVEPLSSVDRTAITTELLARGQNVLSIAPNPVRRSDARILIAGEGAGLRSVQIVDAVGRIRAVLDVSVTRTMALPRNLPTGRYTAVAHDERSAFRIAFVVINE